VHENKTSAGAGSASGDGITVLLRTTTGERQVRGGVQGNSLRLLGVDDIGIEVPLSGNLIFFRNRDVPGVVGKIGTLLGQHNINIGNFALGRSGAEAIAVVEVDSPAPEEVLEELRRLPQFQEVRGVKI
jgi:D-3-phosphoglycerate dehydrogenase